MTPKVTWIFLLFGYFLLGQETKKVVDKNLPKANKSYQQKKYAEAEKNYRISSYVDVNGAIPEYNMGNAIYRQKYPAESLENFTKSIQKAKTKEEKHQIYHNMGNAMMQIKDYQNAVEAFKNALRNNPNDEETRYNYALAKLYLKNNPPPPQDNQNQDQQNEQNQQNQQNKDNKSDQNKEQDKQDKGDNDQNKNDSPNPKQDQQKQQLENLLEAVNNEEKKTQEKVNAKKAQGRVIKQEKEW
ncbi:MAG: tetratricopeptide repeat protein [Flavobacterium sp.]